MKAEIKNKITCASSEVFCEASGIRLTKVHRNVYKETNGDRMFYITKSRYYNDNEVSHSYRYWFSYHRKALLIPYEKAFYILECGEEAIFLIPVTFLEANLYQFNPRYASREPSWFLRVSVDSKCLLKTKPEYDDLDITNFRIE